VHEYSSTVYTPKGHSGYGPNMQHFQLNPFPIKFGEASNLVKM